MRYFSWYMKKFGKVQRLEFVRYEVVKYKIMRCEVLRYGRVGLLLVPHIHLFCNLVGQLSNRFTY